MSELLPDNSKKILKNKVIDGGTADNQHQIILPQNTTVNLDALQRDKAAIYYDTTLNGVVVDNGISLNPIGATGVASLNGIIGAVDLIAGSNITLTPSGSNITIASISAGSVTGVTASSPLSSSGGTIPNISISKANATTDGYVSLADWNTFNNKQATLSFIAPLVETGTVVSIPEASISTNGYLSAADWSIFNNKLSPSFGNYITNPDAEINTAGWNLYNNSGNTATAYVVISDITFTAVAAGAAGNGIDIDYIFHPTQSYTTPLVTVLSSTHVTVAWYNGPTILNNPSATQLKAAWDAVPGAVALATSAISGIATNLQYITGGHLTANGGDTTPTTGTGGVVTGVTFTRNTSTPLVGLASFDLGKDAANRQGEGVSTDFTINALDLGQTLQISFAYEGSSGMVLGSSSDVQVFVYDITNATLIPVIPLRTLTGPINTAKTFIGKFQSVSSSSSYRLILHITTTSATAWDLLLDEVTVNDVITPGMATQVPSLVVLAEPISGAVTDRMVVMWTDGASQWVPATQTGASGSISGDLGVLLGFATNIVGSVADIYLAGYMNGFSFGPFAGYEQYIDNIAGQISPLPSPFTDTYVGVGKSISSTELIISFYKHVDAVGIKGGLLTNTGANNGGGDSVLAVGANGNVLVANSAAANGINWAPAVVAGTGLTYTTSTRTLTVGTLNQNTTGSAATLTTARTIAGSSFNGSANITLANKFIVQGTSDAGLTGAQFLGALATGIVKNTTTTGVLSIAVAGDFPTLNQSTTGTAANITATSNSTLTTVSSLSLLGSQVSGNISGNATNVTGTVVVANGGTGLTSTTPYSVLAGGTTSTGALQQVSGLGTAGQLLGSNGAGALPTWQTPSITNGNPSGSQFITSGTTFTTLSTVNAATQFKFTLIGGGGGGAGTAATANNVGAGGGGGAVGVVLINGLVASTGYTIAVGAGGTGGTAGANAGSNGGNTTITIGATTYTAGFGSGATAGVSKDGGVGGTCTNTTLSINGGIGGSVATAATTSISGYGGDSPGYGCQTAGRITIGSGATATGYGAGGAGAKSVAATAEAGGNGAAGAILVEWYN